MHLLKIVSALEELIIKIKHFTLKLVSHWQISRDCFANLVVDLSHDIHASVA